MNNRLKLQTMLEEICPNVYFQPPSNITLKYPAIVYSFKRFNTNHANDEKYINREIYDINVMDKNPESEIVKKLIKNKYVEFDNAFVSGGLNQTNLTIYI